MARKAVARTAFQNGPERLSSTRMLIGDWRLVILAPWRGRSEVDMFTGLPLRLMRFGQSPRRANSGHYRQAAC